MGSQRMLMHTPFPTGLSGVRDLRAKKRSSSNSSRDWLRLRREALVQARGPAR
jgi:hypothetical protein